LRPESAEEARRVEAFAAERGLPFALGRGDVRAAAAAQHLSLEEAARNQRYAFLFAQAQAAGAQAVVTGHNADDQVETALMHLLRGAGLAGLRGMSFRSLPNPWSASIPLARPLLGVWREQILAYLAGHGLAPNLDASNFDTTFYRNRLRHELIPALESYNPQARRLIWRTADILAHEDAALKAVEDAAWNEIAAPAGGKAISLETGDIGSLPLGVQRRVLRRAIAALRPTLRDVDYMAVERGLAFLHAGRGRRVELNGGLSLFRQGGRVYLAERQEDIPPGDAPQAAWSGEETLAIPGRLALGGGWELRAALDQPPLEEDFANPDPRPAGEPWRAWFDYDALPGALSVRARRPGDRLHPLGMSGSLKVSDLMINRKVPRPARAAWPLVCAGGQVLWVVGLRQGQTARATSGARCLLRLEAVMV
jgi:tRNA(Ile)-lysidine synthase